MITIAWDVDDVLNNIKDGKYSGEELGKIIQQLQDIGAIR